jgi:hypothetical protein
MKASVCKRPGAQRIAVSIGLLFSAFPMYWALVNPIEDIKQIPKIKDRMIFIE